MPAKRFGKGGVMKAVVFHGVGHIVLDDVDEPKIESATDAVIKIVSSSICGTDLHMVRGTMTGMKYGTILGHEAVGIVEKIGQSVKSVKVGDRVVVCSTIACGDCTYCKYEEYASCDRSNPNGPEAGTAFFGGPESTGPFNGLQAERARIPYADSVLVKLPKAVTDADGLLCSDIFPTGYMGAEMADVKQGDYIAVFGCGPVGQMAIASAIYMGAKEVFAIDICPDRLKVAEQQGAIAINFEKLDPVQSLREMTNGFGPDGVIDAVGIDAVRPHKGPAVSIVEVVESAIEKTAAAPLAVLTGNHWKKGDGPDQVLRWCVDSVRKSGVVSIIGVYPETEEFFPIGKAMGKSLTVRAANCSHRKYIPKCLDMMKNSQFKPSKILTVFNGLENAIECYKHFDKREPGWLKVELMPDDVENCA
jgi:threonine dehydrogenase-like Zn-dependent dehydrogenase